MIQMCYSLTYNEDFTFLEFVVSPNMRSPGSLRFLLAKKKSGRVNNTEYFAFARQAFNIEMTQISSC